MTSWVYVIENRVNGKAYVGWTVDVKRRWIGHVRWSKSSKKPLYNSMRKHGLEQFTMHVVEEFTNSELALASEREWITYLRGMNVVLYNLTDGGDGTAGHRHAVTPEVRKQISQTLKGKQKPPFSEEHRANIAKASKRRYQLARDAYLMVDIQ